MPRLQTHLGHTHHETEALPQLLQEALSMTAYEYRASSIRSGIAASAASHAAAGAKRRAALRLYLQQPGATVTEAALWFGLSIKRIKELQRSKS